MRLRLSQRLNIYIGGLLVLGFLAIIYDGYRSSERLIHEIGLSEAERLGKAVFNDLFTSMRLGGVRVENREIIERYRTIEGIEEVRVVHGPPIDRQFGVEPDEQPQDELDRIALLGRESRVVEEGAQHRIRYVMPVFVREECTRCHNARPGEVNGAISIRLSLARHEAIIKGYARDMVLWGGALIALSYLVILVTINRRLFVPLKKLSEGFRAIAGGDLSHRVKLRTGDEFEEISTDFDRMAESLSVATSRLRDTSEKYMRLVETAADGIVLKDAVTMKTVEANTAAAVLSGYTKEELCRMPGERLYPEEMVYEYRKDFRRWVHDGKGFLHDAVIMRRDGSRFPVEIAASTVEIGGEKYVLEVWRDITERKGFVEKLNRQIEVLEEMVRKRTEALNNSLTELKEAYEKLQESEQKIVESAKLVSMGEMGAGIAHELNSPLAGILSITEVLLGRIKKDDPNHALLEKVKDAAVRSKYIILDMLTYARPFKAETEPFYINLVVKATLSLFISEFKVRSIEIQTELDPGLPKVSGNKGQIMEVMLNILKNARDAMPGGGKIRITTRTIKRDGRPAALIEIKDTGPGIPPEIIHRVFDPFFTTKAKGGGVNIGLGLSIAQSMVKEHGGSIEAGNDPEGGAVFRITLPAAPEEGA